MWPTSNPLSIIGLVRGALVVALVVVNGHGPLPSVLMPVHGQEQSGAPGQSATLLPDGRWLLIGGEQSQARKQLSSSRTRLRGPLHHFERRPPSPEPGIQRRSWLTAQFWCWAASTHVARP